MCDGGWSRVYDIESLALITSGLTETSRFHDQSKQVVVTVPCQVHFNSTS